MLIVSPSAAVPSTFMPLPFRNTLAGRPVVLDTALLPCPFLPPSEKETICDFPCPDGSAPHGNAANIAVWFAAATIQQGRALPGIPFSTRQRVLLHVAVQQHKNTQSKNRVRLVIDLPALLEASQLHLASCKFTKERSVRVFCCPQT